MPKILVVSDDEQTVVEIQPMADPTLDVSPDGEAEDRDPWYRATCRKPGCWDSFLDQNTVHLLESDAINDAEHHIDEHEHAEL